ncbi:hypothetical protein ABID44_002856 [Aquamicrobium ahrensii]|uniref:Uncharacterized protein n=1 Tax=Aquamicrobium ahrensii TaxID=469551 RepID=A0ABV2KN56_9HYPH
MKTAIHVMIVAFAVAVIGALVAVAVPLAEVDPSPTDSVTVE